MLATTMEDYAPYGGGRPRRRDGGTNRTPHRAPRRIAKTCMRLMTLAGALVGTARAGTSRGSVVALKFCRPEVPRRMRPCRALNARRSVYQTPWIAPHADNCCASAIRAPTRHTTRCRTTLNPLLIDPTHQSTSANNSFSPLHHACNRHAS